MGTTSVVASANPWVEDPDGQFEVQLKLTVMTPPELAGELMAEIRRALW